MAALSSFPGWLVTPEAAPRVVTPPYDVLTPTERGALAAAEPDSFLNVMRARDDQVAGPAPARAELLAASRATLERLLAAGAFAPTPGPAYHVLRMRVDDHVQTGIVGTVPVDDIGATVRLHEDTREAKEDDLVRHLEVVGVTSSPVSLVHPGLSPVADLLAAVTGRPPSLALAQADGLHQEVWTLTAVDEVATVRDRFAALPALYVTDGHHRAAAALRHAERRRAEAGPDPDAPWAHLLVVAFPAPELRLFPYHRVVRDVGGRRPDAVLAALAREFEVRPLDVRDPDEAAPTRAGSFAVHLDGSWHALRTDGDPHPVGPVAALDVTVLQERILRPVLGVVDPRTDPRLEFVPGTLGLAELVRRAGPAGAAFALAPTGVDQLIAVADAGAVMPPKSTWFDPKIRSGMFLRRVTA